MIGPHTVAVIERTQDLDCEALLEKVVRGWRERTVRVVGLLAENDETPGACSAAFLRDIVSGGRFQIRLDAPPADSVCHLNPEGMEEAGERLLAQIPAADIVVLSKFGKLETMKRGLWTAFVAATAARRPLLTTVSSTHAASWNAFAPGAVWLDGDRPSIEGWRQSVQSHASLAAARVSAQHG